MPKVVKSKSNNKATSLKPRKRFDNQVDDVQTTYDKYLVRGKLEITTKDEYDEVGEFARGVKALVNNIKSYHEPLKSKAWATHRAIVEAEKEQLETPTKLLDEIKQARARFRKLDEQRQLEEQERQEREIQANAEESTVERATELLREGKDDEAEELLSKVASGEVEPTVALPPVKLQPPKQQGFGVRKLKRYRVVNENEVKKPFWMIDHKAVNAQVQAIGKEAEKVVGGIEVYFVDSESISGL